MPFFTSTSGGQSRSVDRGRTEAHSSPKAWSRCFSCFFSENEARPSETRKNSRIEHSICLCSRYYTLCSSDSIFLKCILIFVWVSKLWRRPRICSCAVGTLGRNRRLNEAHPNWGLLSRAPQEQEDTKGPPHRVAPSPGFQHTEGHRGDQKKTCGIFGEKMKRAPLYRTAQ